ncbi:MAG: HAMP domain-containing protein [Chloroflexi bacterium]|nr:HAMP domain-containing protein [Chloroflexota bacterium]
MAGRGSLTNVLRKSLHRRLILLVVLGIMVILAGLMIAGWLAGRESTNRTLEERREMAGVVAQYLEYVLRQNLLYLEEAGAAQGLGWEDGRAAPDRQALHEAYLRSIFSNGVYLIDQQGTVRWVEPYRPDQIGASLYGYPHIQQALGQGRPVVSDLFLGPTGRATIALATPLRDTLGHTAGLVVGEIDVTGRGLREVLRPMRLGKTGYVEVADSQGTVLASAVPEHLLASSSNTDGLASLIQEGRRAAGIWPSGVNGEREVTAFSPLPIAGWGVVIRQAEGEALAWSLRFRQRLLLLGFSLLALGTALAWGVARSVVGPVGALTAAAQRIAGGDLAQTIPPQGEDEIGRLAHSLEVMRSRLKESLEQVQGWNRELEDRVGQRTQELEQRHRELSRLNQELYREETARRELLGKVISAQEEERKRIARELHDETSQSLAALAMAIDTSLTSSEASASSGRLANMKDMVVRTLEGVHQLIFDLRPSLLDDLGLLPALRWYAESRLRPQGIEVRFVSTGPERRLPSETEIALFRVVQEAVTNILKHAEAENVVIRQESTGDAIRIEVEDDGRGFDISSIGSETGQVRGLGLLGIRERVEMLGGRFAVVSQPGKGTRIVWEVPVTERNGRGQD